MKRAIFVPFGRLDDLRSRPDAELIAYTVGRSWDSNYRITVYASRKALEAFCRAGSQHHALVKRDVDGTMIVNRNTQRPV